MNEVTPNNPSSIKLSDELITLISSSVTEARVGESTGDIINRNLEIFFRLNVFDSITFFSMDSVSFTFHPRYHLPKEIDLREKYELFSYLVEKEYIPSVLQNVITEIVYTEDATIIIIPIIANTIVEGIILTESKNKVLEIDEYTKKMLLVFGSYLGSQIEIVNLGADLRTTQRLVEQKVAAQTMSLNQLRIKLKTIIDNVLIGIILVDSVTNSIEEANVAALSMLGGESEDILHKNINDFLHMMEDEEANEVFANLAVREGALTKLNGLIIPLVRTSVGINLDGKDYLVESFIDITERKEAEERLHRLNMNLDVQVKKRTEELEIIVSKLENEITERNRIEEALSDSENILSLVFDTTSIGLCLSDHFGKILRVNKEFANIFDTNEAHCEGKSLALFLNMYIRNTMGNSINSDSEYLEELSSGEPVETMLMGNKKYIYMSSAKLKREDNAVYYITAITDITKQKLAETEIRNALQKEKELHDLKTNFISMVSHEFRTPLTTILSYTQLLKKYRHQWTSEQQEQYLDNIEIGVKRMTNLLNDALLVGQNQSGFLVFNPTSTNISKLCSDIVNDLLISYHFERKINFLYSCSTDSYTVDGKLLYQVLFNLISNAIKYSPKETAVDFTIFDSQQELTVIVEDRGIGIPEEELTNGRIFEPFVRADNVGNVSGTGLGMAIVKNAVELQKGSIDIYSKQGEGTKITVNIPIVNTEKK